MRKRTVECALLILALLMSLLSVSAFAAPARDKSSLDMENVIINEFDSIYHNDGETVINNFGIVYNNGGTVYNNGGTVYNNEGIVYNNGGVVFNNGAQVYNNGGTVHNNGGTVYETGYVTAEAEPEEVPAEETPAEEVPVGEAPSEKAPEEETVVPEPEQPGNAPEEKPDTEPLDEGLFIIEMTGDYSDLADIEGLTQLPDGRFAIAEGESASIRAKEGLVLTDAMTTAGNCSVDSSGAITLANVDRNGRLTLKFKLKAPQASLVSGSYVGGKYLSLSAEAYGARVLYTTDSTSPLKGQEAKGAVKIEKSMVLRAVAVMEGAADSEQLELIYVFPELEEPEFKDAKPGYKPIEPKPAVLINTGLDTVYVESVRLEGRDADCFTLSSEKGKRLASGQRDDSSWMIAPVEGLSAGDYEAEVVFTFASGDRLSDDFDFTVKK